MEITILLLLCACPYALSEPLSAAIKRRSDVFGVYASEFARQYEPVAYVAIPLNAPLPVLHMLSSSPLEPKPSPGKKRNPSKPGQPQNPRVYAASMSYAWFTKPGAHGYTNPKGIRKPVDSYQSQETEPVVLYARPNKNGGYSYRKRPTKKRNTSKREPLIIRVHKYRVVRDR